MNINGIFRDTSKKMIGCLIFGCMATFISMGFLQGQSRGLECQNTPEEHIEEYINYLSSTKVTNNDNKDNIEELLQDFIYYKTTKVEKLKKPLALRGGQPGQVGFNREDINTPAIHRKPINNKLAYEKSETKIKCKADEEDKCERLNLEIEGDEIQIRRLQRYIDDFQNRISKDGKRLGSLQAKGASNERKCKSGEEDECRSLEINIELNTMNIKNYRENINDLQQRISGKRNELKSLSVE